MHFSRQLNCWSLRCSWSIASRRCSNYIFILNLTPGFNGLGKENYNMRREASKFWDLVRLILETLRYALFSVMYILQSYGWFIVAGIILALYLKSKLEPKWQEMKRKQEDRSYLNVGESRALFQYKDLMLDSRLIFNMGIPILNISHCLITLGKLNYKLGMKIVTNFFL